MSARNFLRVVGGISNQVLSTILTGLSTASSATITASDTVLSALGKLQAQISLKAPINNPTFTGTATTPDIVVGSNSDTSPTIRVNGAAGSLRSLVIQTAGLARWLIKGSSSAETGGNAGTNFGIERYDDSGTIIDVPFAITRSTGQATFLASPLVPTPAPGDNTTKAATTAFVLTELAAKQPLDATLTALAALAIANNKMLIGTGTDAFSTADFINGGTWTPAFTLATPGTLSVSYTSRTGRYLKIGNWVLFLFNITFTPTYGTGTGALRFDLPMAASADDVSGGAMLNFTNSNFTLPAGLNQYALNIGPSASFATLRGLGSGQDGADLTHSNLSGTGIVSAFGFYKAAV